MAPTSPDRVIRFDQIAPAGSFRFVTGGTYAGIEPLPGQEAALAAVIARPHPHMQCWAKEAIPAALHYGKNPRVPRYLCLAEPGWLVVDRAPPPDRPVKAGGAHGYDPAAPDMAALFIASGPAIKPMGPIPSFDNIDVAPLLRRLLALPPGRDLDGTDAPFRAALAN